MAPGRYFFVALVGSTCLSAGRVWALSVPSEALQERIAESIALAPEANQSLMICNGYAYKEPISVFRVRGDVRVTRTPIAYKGCQSVFVKLEETDRLDFKAGSMNIGAFFATGLPKQSTQLLLIPHRRDGSTMAVAFESHAFMDLQTSQVAVVDAYRGSEAAVIRIVDSQPPQVDETTQRGVSSLQQDHAERRTEELKFNSVVALSTGQYQIQLVSSHIEVAVLMAAEVGVAKKVNYVAMRVGIDSGPDAEYPQELVVFPRTSLDSEKKPGLFGGMISGFLSVVGLA